MTEFRVLAENLKFPEGPIVMRDGTVLLVEIARGTLTRVSPTGAIEVVAELGGGPNGAAIGPDGAAYVCNNGGFQWYESDGLLLPHLTPPDYRGGSIQRVDLQTGTVKTLYTHCGTEPLKGPNDIVFDSHGGFWFTDSGKRRPRSVDVGAIYYAKIDGSSISEVLYPVTTPNGVALSPDESVLYFAETETGRVWGYKLSAPGMVYVPPGLFSDEALLYGAPGLDWYDSMAVEAEGNVCVATVGHRGGITVLNPAGEFVEFVPMPDPGTSNLAFGGPQMQHAYITLSCTGKLIERRWPRPGLELQFAR